MIDYKKYICFESGPQCGMMTYGSILEGVKKMLYWLPRIFAILYILFFGVFALDSLDTVVGFGMHLIPSGILLLFTVIAWKKARVGGILFCLTGIFMLVFYHTVGIAIPAFVISVLLLWKSK